MVDERQLVLDANILIRAVLGRRVRQIIEDNARRPSAGEAPNRRARPLPSAR